MKLTVIKPTNHLIQPIGLRAQKYGKNQITTYQHNLENCYEHLYEMMFCFWNNDLSAIEFLCQSHFKYLLSIKQTK